VDDALTSLQGFKRIGAGGQYQMANRRALLADDATRVINMLEAGELKRDSTIETELAATIATVMMGGNQPAQETIQHFQSPTANKTLAGIFKYATGKPQDAMTPEIVTHFKHQMEGQSKFWKQKRDNIHKSLNIQLDDVFAEYPRLKDRFDKASAAIFEEAPFVPRKKEEPPLGTQKPGKDGKMYIYVEDPETGERGYDLMTRVVEPRGRMQ
jgi:hypothetical protein